MLARRMLTALLLGACLVPWQRLPGRAATLPPTTPTCAPLFPAFMATRGSWYRQTTALAFGCITALHQLARSKRVHLALERGACTRDDRAWFGRIDQPSYVGHARPRLAAARSSAVPGSGTLDWPPQLRSTVEFSVANSLWSIRAPRSCRRSSTGHNAPLEPTLRLSPSPTRPPCKRSMAGYPVRRAGIF